jgi:hypothetical protein
MDIFFNWHSSEHGFNLDVKWNPKARFRCEQSRQNGAAKDHSWLHTPTAIAGPDRTRANRLLGFQVAVG